MHSWSSVVDMVIATWKGREMIGTNTRLNSLQMQYDAMRSRIDVDPRTLTRYQELIEEEHQLALEAVAREREARKPHTKPTGSISSWMLDHGLRAAG